MLGKLRKISDGKQLELLNDKDLIKLRWAVETEMRRRKLPCSVGELGEELVIEYYRITPGLAKLQRSPRGTKNVDALSRNGERYSIKTLWNAKKTGTIYPDRADPQKQLFEHLVVVRLNDNLALQTIHQFTWDQFVNVRKWDKRMSAWYLGISARTFSSEVLVYQSMIYNPEDVG